MYICGLTVVIKRICYVMLCCRCSVCSFCPFSCCPVPHLSVLVTTTKLVKSFHATNSRHKAKRTNYRATLRYSAVHAVNSSCVRPSVRHTPPYCIETTGRCFSARRLPSTYILYCVRGNSGNSKNNNTSLWNFVQK